MMPFPHSRALLVAGAILCALVCASPAATAADSNKVLRLSSPDITSLDPQQGTDLYSTRVTTAIFEALYQYDYLASPAKVIPNTAEALPVITENGRTWTMRLKKGIFFADDPVFAGKPRELVAADYVYSIKRSIDPLLRNGGDPELTNLFVGARPVVESAKAAGAKFNYDAPIEGLRAIDRYTLQLKLTGADYTLLDRLAQLPAHAVAREAVEAAGNEVMMKPVGTGPFVLKDWKRGSRVTLEANQNYRAIAFPDNADPAHRALVQAMQGHKLPAIGRIEISVIEELVPELLAFDQGNLDYVLLTSSVLDRILDKGALKPEYAKRGIRHIRYTVPALIYMYFNMDDPLVGGMDTAQVALRRAIALGFDNNDFIKVLYNGQALPANQLLPPGVAGHDSKLPAKSIYDPAAARALLDRFGFKDRDGDGFRERPDGKPLLLIQSSLPDSFGRELGTLWIKNMEAIGLKMQMVQAPFADLLKQSLAGQLMMFNLGARSLDPTGFQILSLLYGKSPPATNRTHFKLPEYDAAYEKFLRTPDGPERTALAQRMSELVQVYVPLTLQVYPIGNAFAQPWVLGYYPSPFGFSWKYLDIDLGKQTPAKK